jgi:hypothetical protein
MLATLPRRRGNALLREAARLLESEESVALLMPIRPPSEYAIATQARREAVSVFRQILPALIASLPGEDT